MKKFIALGLLALAFVALPSAAQPQPVYATADAHLRAGPAPDYPVIATLPAGFAVSVQSCLGDYSWCDVIAGPERGWVYAANLGYAYGGGYVPLRDQGPQLGIVIAPFVLFDYWDRFYRDRPFYGDRNRWAHRARPPHPPSAPPRRQDVVPGVPPLQPAGVPPLAPAGVPSLPSAGVPAPPPSPKPRPQ